MGFALQDHESEPTVHVHHQEREEIRGADEGVPDGYFTSPIFLGTILAVGLGMFSVRPNLQYFHREVEEISLNSTNLF